MITQSRTCPLCKRVVFPTRSGHWPHHLKTPPGGDWCSKSGNPIMALRK